ncbi:MAG: hypothetical protein C4331_03605 [Meiothermus sp.]
MKTVWVALLLAAGLLVGCQSTSALNQGSGSSQDPATGMEGHVYRGPVVPVCTENTPCDAPFSGGFVVWKYGIEVARFRSDEKGYFKVALEPGSYTVTLDDKTQVGLPMRQMQSVAVKEGGMTQVTLSFDTGIR